MTDANELKQMIEDLAQRLSHTEAIRGDEVAALRERIEKLEGKERTSTYDPATNSVAQAVVDTLNIRGCKVISQEDIKTAIEQFETAQQQTEERFSSLEDDLEAETAARMAADDALSASIKLLSK